MAVSKIPSLSLNVILVLAFYLEVVSCGPTGHRGYSNSQGGSIYFGYIFIGIFALGLFAILVWIKCRQMKDQQILPKYPGPRVQCYLCERWMPEHVWRDVSMHRRECAKKPSNSSWLASLPEPHDVPCGNCGQRLKQFKLRDGRSKLQIGRFGTRNPESAPKFKCRHPQCRERGLDLTNNGNNRFNCFHCDFDLCGSCVMAEANRVRVTVNPFGQVDQQQFWAPTAPPPPYAAIKPGPAP